MGYVSRSSGLLCLEASQTRVFQFASKLAEARRRVVHVASSRRSRGDEAEDGRVNVMGCIRLLYPNFVILSILDPRGILVFCLDL
jgi:hypothetical protein